MLIFLQLPFADIRDFTPKAIGRLPYPIWPSPLPNKEFIRSHGQIFSRGKGGVNGWVLEDKLCGAQNAFRFRSPLEYHDKNTGKTFPIKCLSRHFYFDGYCVCKYELVFGLLQDNEIFHDISLLAIINHILNISISINLPKKYAQTVELKNCIDKLGKAYIKATTFKEYQDKVIKKGWILPGEPTILVVQNKYEHPPLLTPSKFVPFHNKRGLILRHLTYKEPGQEVGVWYIKEIYQNSRKLRIYIMRLHAELHVLRQVLRRIAIQEIKTGDNSKESDFLQDYLNSATRRISKYQNRTLKHFESEDIFNLAINTLDYVSPGERESLIQSLNKWNYRPQIRKKSINFYDCIFEEQVIMNKRIEGDIIQVNAEKSVIATRGAQIQEINFEEVWNTYKEDIDFDKLSKELSQLRTKLKESATDIEHDVSIGLVAKAEEAAKTLIFLFISHPF